MAGEAAGGFLSVLSGEQVAELHRVGVRRRFRRGARLFSDGDRSDRVYVVLAGRVKLSHFTRDGGEEVLAITGPGDLLGELSAIDGKPRSATGVAMEDVDAVVVGSDDFRRFVRSHPDVALAILLTVTTRLRDADRKRVEFGTHDTIGRVALRLLELAERFGTRDGEVIRIGLPMTQEELAGWTGSSREAVVKALRTMREQGWIETARREIRVVDLPALEQRAR